MFVRGTRGQIKRLGTIMRSEKWDKNSKKRLKCLIKLTLNRNLIEG